jgi:hypothetical protein
MAKPGQKPEPIKIKFHRWPSIEGVQQTSSKVTEERLEVNLVTEFWQSHMDGEVNPIQLELIFKNLSKNII